MRIREFVRACALVLAAAATPAFAEEIRDYYAEPGINPFKEAISDAFHESVDPFSGTMQFKYTDVHIPGNGGMDLDIVRTYTSLQTGAYPVLNQNGMGWTMHFGRIVVPKQHLNKICTQSAFPLTTKENPSLELPDGGREILALSTLHNDGTLITRSNWIARCNGGQGMIVTAPDGTRYTMDRFDNFQEEPAFLTTRIEDVDGNWIAIDYAVNAVGINYITQIRRSGDGVIATFQYEDIATAGIAISEITANGQHWSYGYEPVPGNFMFPNYKQLVRATRPDGRSWYYQYNDKIGDTDPDDGVLMDGPGSYSLKRVTYPYGTVINYTYDYVQFDPGSFERTTVIKTKTVSGGDVPGGLWTFDYAPHSAPYDDGAGGTLRYDVTTVTSPTSVTTYKHFGKDFRPGPNVGQTIFVRPSFVGLLVVKETRNRIGNSKLVERLQNSWGQRKISEEDFWHGSGYREWWRDDGTYAPVLLGEYVSRDDHIGGNTFAHARLFSNFDSFGNPGSIYSHSSVTGQPGHRVTMTYFNDPSRWIVSIPKDETHYKVVDGADTGVGQVTRDLDANGKVLEIDEFGEKTRYTYNTEGDLHTTRDARGKTTTFTDYKRGIARHEVRPEGVTIDREVNDDGSLHSETDGRGNVTSYAYDALHRLTGINYPIKADVTIDYEPLSDGYKRILTRGNYRQTETINDFNQTLRLERRDTATNQTVFITSRYDAAGNHVFSSYPNGTNGKDMQYDALGRLQRITHPDNTFINYVYDDAQVNVTNERGFTTEYLYAFLGNSYSQEDPAYVKEPERITTLMYRDVWGNIIKLFQGEEQPDHSVRGYEKTYRYDESRQLVESNEPEVGTTVFGHDEVGNVTSERVNDLPEVTFHFDGLNRRTSVDFSDDTPDIVTQYDADGNIERVTKGRTEWFYVYDENGNVRSERLTINHPLFAPRVYTTTNDYNDLDVLSSITYPSGLTVDYAPDAFGHATRVGTFATNVTYHPSGAIASYQLANGVTTNVALNQRLLTQSISAPGVMNLSYGYDAGGNVLSIVDGIDASKNVRMNAGDYDGVDRLKASQGSWGYSGFGYDFQGNITVKEVGARGLKYYYDPLRRLRQVDRYTSGQPNYPTGNIRLDYDARGNNTAKRSASDLNTAQALLDEKLFTYDSASHLVKARVTRTNNAGASLLANKEYAYDGNGQRVVEQQHGTYDIRFSVYTKTGGLMFEDTLADCTRTDHIRLGTVGIARSDDQLAAPSLDTDGDQITDCYESALGLDPNNAADAAADQDGDGLTNLQEFRAGTSISRVDTDGDGLSDRDEVQRDLTDPNSGDSDGDGLPDALEAANPQLDPRNADKDHDGVNDFWEIRLNTDPSTPDGLVDTDTDGFSNRQESLARGNPELLATKPARGTLAWSANLLATVYDNAAIGKDRTVYVSGADGHLYAYWPDGTLRFKYGADFEKILPPTVGPDGSIYAVVKIYGGIQDGAPRSYIRALNADGSQRWSWGTIDYLESPVSVGEGGRLYFSGYQYSSWYGFAHFVESLSDAGSTPQMRLTDYDSITAPAVTPNGDVIFTMANSIMAFSKALEPRWTFHTRANMYRAPTVGKDGSVYVGDNYGWLYAVKPDGTLRWEVQITQGGQQSSVAIGADGTLYTGGYQSRIVALNPADGSTRWNLSTSGTTFTPAVAADGSIYATTYAGDLYAFTADGAVNWRYTTGSRIYASPVVDRDGTIYFGTDAGQFMAVVDNGGGPARTPWPMERHDAAATGNICFNEPASSLTADTDGDKIDDCSEYRYGLDPANAADGAVDTDGDGLRNFEEHERGTRIDLADTDGDGLNDGLEVLAYHTNPVAADSDHDTVPDGREIELHTNPLDATEANADFDGDGFSNRQESLAGTDPMLAGSVPTAGQLARSQPTLGRNYSVGRDGTIYRTLGDYSSTQLEALYPDFTTKWRVPAPSTGAGPPVIGADGSIYLVEPAAYGKQRLVAYWPNGLIRWAYAVDVPNSYYRIGSSVAVGADGRIFFIYSANDNQGDWIVALSSDGKLAANWPQGGVQYFGREGAMAIGPDGKVAIYDALNSLTLFSATGARLWQNRTSPIVGGGGGRVIFGADGTLFVRTGTGLIAVNPADGTVRWRLANAQGWPVIDASNHIIVLCSQSYSGLCAVDSNGSVLWTESTGYNYSGAPSIDASGAAVISTNNGKIVAFDTTNGAVRWEAQLPTPPQYTASEYPVVLSDGTIFVPSYPQDMWVIGTGKGLANSPWPARDHDFMATRDQAGVAPQTPSSAPSVIISDPRTASINVEVGEARVVSAVASDFGDGDLSGSIHWSSSIDGEFAIGRQASLMPLSTGNHTITASVTDSENQTSSATFQVNKAIFPPTLTIGPPYPNETRTYDFGQQIQFSGYAVDQLDGYISERIRWISDRDGLLGTGSTLYKNNLSVGTHLITATVSDLAGATDTKTATVIVAMLGPDIYVGQPGNMAEVEFGEPTTFNASAYDAVDGDMSSTLTWSSDRDGPLGSGATIEVATLSLGTHVITVTAHDLGGTFSNRTFSILVRHVPPYIYMNEPYGTSYQLGDDISFNAYAEDSKDGTLSDNVVWTSSLDGTFGTAGAFTFNGLSVGTHVITASITDSDGAQSTVDRVITVSSSSNSAPWVSILQPWQGTEHYVGDPLLIQGTAGDGEDGDLTSTIAWSTELGPLGTGETLTTSSLPVGTHRLKGFVSDSAGGKAAVFQDVVILPLPPNFRPQVTIADPPRGYQYTAQSSFTMTATATDREEGDISSRIQWSSDLDGPLGTGKTVFIRGLTAGVNSVTATITDTYGDSASTTYNLYIADTGEAKFFEDLFFNGGTPASDWVVVNEASPATPNWQVTSGRMTENSDAQAGDATASALPKPGTYLLQSMGLLWLDYRLEAQLRSSDDDALGLMFRYVDGNNYYRFSMDRERSYRRLVKNVNGVFTTLWQDSTRYALNTSYNVVITAVGSQLTLSINGTQVYTGVDTSHRRGSIALYAWGENAAQFDNVRVYNLRNSSSNDAPLLTISSPANNASVIVGSVVSLSGSANDFEDGAMSQSISWSSSRDGALGTGANLNVSSLTLGAHALTASATDSGGKTGTAVVNITVNEPFNNPPTLNVTAPTQNATFNVGATVNLAGTASDVEDGTISNGITWTSSRDGALGSGASLAVTSLTAGAHVITARIQDSGGKFTTTTRNITVSVPNNSQPSITLTAPLNGAAFGVGQTVTLSATATDTEDGNLTSSIAWSSNKVGALGTGGTVNTTALTHGIHVISATVNDTMGGTRTVSVTINVVSTAATLLRDDFNDNNFTGWSITDQGTVTAPSAWSASTGVFRQISDISSTPTTAATIPKPGTFNRWTAGSAWTNYSVTTELRSSDNDTLGVMFRYTGTSNYYRFSMDSERANRRLAKVRNGTWTTLWEDSTAYALNRTYVLEVIANGSTITVKLDGAQLWSGTDTNALTTGTVAMYSWMNTGAQFDNVLVRDLSVAFSGLNEPRRGIERVRTSPPMLAQQRPRPRRPAPSPQPQRVAILTSLINDTRLGGGVR